MKKILILLASISFLLTPIGIKDLKSVTLHCKLGASTYKVHLIDLKPYIMKLFKPRAFCQEDRKYFEEGVLFRREEEKLRLFNLGFVNHPEVFRLGSIDVSDLISSPPTSTIKKLTKRLEETLYHIRETDEYANRYLTIKYIPETTKINRFGKRSNVDAYHVPLLAGVDHPRANLFDMFSPEVDRCIPSYGVGETIAHEDKYNQRTDVQRQFQISLFGIIEGYDSDGKYFFYPGFFQYTFNEEGFCYHRAFKPWTESHLRGLSNSQTQRILRMATLLFLNEKIASDNTNLKLVNIFDKIKETLLKASKTSNDHNCQMFSERIGTDVLWSLLTQVENYKITTR